MDPFKIDGPTCISFSGGRTSAYMLWRVLQSNGGLPADAVVCFANTGKEDEASLAFVQECSERWSVPIVWLEYRPGRAYAVVSYETASRDGQPFDAVIAERQFLPNAVMRFCTVELKILTMARYLWGQGWTEWDSLIGIRADEPARVASVRANPSGGTRGVDRHMPLAEAGVSNQEVLAFWGTQPFDLQLPTINGKTMHGNCDLCQLKPPAQRLALIREKPSRGIWWVRKEEERGGRFCRDGPSYAELIKFAAEQRDMFDPTEEAIACFCGD